MFIFKLHAFVLAISLCASAAWAQSGSYIHGSWVNVREKADASSRALDQLHTNQSIEISERQGAWCKVAYGAGKSGFVQCSLTGSQPLTLQQAAKEPARAFWIAPSSKRLRDYGNSLKPPAHLTLEALQKTKKAGEEIQYPAVPEFEAAKRLMKAGVLLKPENEIRREIADLSKELAGLGLSAPEAQPSLFKTQGSVVLAFEGDSDHVAAVTRSRLSLIPHGIPTGGFDRHQGPEIGWVEGFWDVGQANLFFSPKVIVNTIASTGLVSAQSMSQVVMRNHKRELYCGDRGRLLFDIEDLREQLSKMSLKGYAKLNESQFPLLSLVLSEPLPPRAVKISTMSSRLDPKKLGLQSESLKDALERKLSFKAVAYSIDLDHDGHHDIFIIDRPVRPAELQQSPGISLTDTMLSFRRQWFVNIDGQWFQAGNLKDDECT